MWSLLLWVTHGRTWAVLFVCTWMLLLFYCPKVCHLRKIGKWPRLIEPLEPPHLRHCCDRPGDRNHWPLHRTRGFRPCCDQEGTGVRRLMENSTLFLVCPLGTFDCKPSRVWFFGAKWDGNERTAVQIADAFSVDCLDGSKVGYGMRVGAVCIRLRHLLILRQYSIVTSHGCSYCEIKESRKETFLMFFDVSNAANDFW